MHILRLEKEFGSRVNINNSLKWHQQKINLNR